MDRYSRLLDLSSFSKDKLATLQGKKILIFGAGGVGQHIATYLITNGIRNLTIVDFDKVELSNLNRQILLTEEDVGKYKVDVVKKALEKKNSTANLESINLKVDKNNIDQIKGNYDYIVDAVDNWPTRLVISKFAKEKQIPLLHAGVDSFKGQYCLFEKKSLLDVVNEDIVNEPRDGVMGPMVGLVSSMAATFLIEYIVGDVKESDTIFYVDFKDFNFVKVKL